MFVKFSKKIQLKFEFELEEQFEEQFIIKTDVVETINREKIDALILSASGASFILQTNKYNLW